MCAHACTYDVPGSKALDKYNRIPLAIKGLLKKEGGGSGASMMGMPNNKDEEALTDAERDGREFVWLLNPALVLLLR